MENKFGNEKTFSMSNINGCSRLTLIRFVACSLLVFGFLILLQTPAQATVTKTAGCTTCHTALNTAAVLNVAVNGSSGTAVTVAPGGTFELDWTFTNMVNGTYGVNPELAVPTGWTVAAGTTNSPNVNGGWQTAWDAAAGVSWNKTISESARYPNSPSAYSVDFTGSTWEFNKGSAADDGLAADLDGTASKMGADARITVPAGTAIGAYSVVVLGIGHDASSKGYVAQTITVNVVPTVTSTSPNSLAQGITQNVVITGAGFTNTGLSSNFGSGITVNSTTYNSATQVTANITIDGAATVGSRNVSVTCSGQTGSGTGIFSVTMSNLTATTTTVTNPTAITYGQSASFTATVAPAAATGTVQFKVDGANVGSPVTVSSGSATISGVSGLAAGSRSVTAVYSGDSTYATSTSSAVTQTVNAKTLIITADAKSKTYGVVDPALTYTSSGLVGGDTISGSLTRVAGENVGIYAINQGTLSAGSNYTISYTAANLTINAATISVTADAKSKTYGTADPALTYTASGFVNGDTVAIMNGSLTRAAGENVGIYAISQGTVAATSNYTINYTGANLTVTAATLTVTADAKSKTYGAAEPALTYTASGFVNGDTSSIMTGTLSRAAGEDVGIYAINQGSVAATSNYSISYTGANLTVTEADQIITFGALIAKNYGDSDYAPGGSASSGLTVSYASSDPAVATIVGGNIHIVGVGTTTITASQAGDNNYNAASDVPQSLTVNAKTLTITADAKSKTYGATDPALTYVATGLVGGDTISGSLSRAVGENVGNYAINQGSLNGGSNYTISYTSANLTINTATLTVTADAKSKTYGGADPALTYTASGFANGDTSAIMAGSLARAAGENVGEYAINQGTVAATSNYIITYTSANLTVNAAPLSVTAEAKSKAYGEDEPVLTYTTSGFVNGDTNAIMTGSLTRTAGEDVGIYSISQGSVAATSNYTISYTGANLTITVASQTITIITPAPATAVYLTQFAVAATADSGLAVTYSSGSPSICTNSGETFTMINGTGNCVVQYDQSGDSNYSAAPQVTNSVTAEKASQTIDPITFEPTTLAVSGTTTASALTTSGLAASFTSDTPAFCTVSGSTVTGVSAGECTIRASQGGNDNYSAATDVTKLLTVTGGSTNVTLTVTLAGTGSGTVNSIPSGAIACSGDCTETYTSGTEVTLTATPAAMATFAGWSGGSCSGTGDCVFNLTADTTVTATFDPSPLVMLPGPVYYATIQDAYNAASADAVMTVRDQTFNEHLVFDGANVTFVGGYDDLWNPTTGYTTIIGDVTIGTGGITVSNIAIQ